MQPMLCLLLLYAFAQSNKSMAYYLIMYMQKVIWNCQEESDRRRLAPVENLLLPFTGNENDKGSYIK